MFGPANLPDTLDMLARDMAAIRKGIETLVDHTGDQAPPTPDVEPRSLTIGSVAGMTSWQTSEQMRIIGCVLSTDTIGRYCMQFGTDASRCWRLNSGAAQDLGLSSERYLVVPRGLVLTFTVPANAAWDATLWWLPGTAEGRQSH